MNTLDLAMMLECLGPFERGPALYSFDCGFGGHSPNSLASGYLDSAKTTFVTIQKLHQSMWNSGAQGC